MRRAPLFAMLAVLVSSLLFPTFAAADEGIVLRGSRSAYVDLYVYVATTISAADIDFTTKGTYVGFFLSPAPANRDTVGGLVMPRVGATGQDSASVIRLGESWDVGPGKYRAFLLTDGASEVFIPIKGQGLRGWVPRGRAPVSVRRADFDIPAGSPGGSLPTKMTLRARSLVMAAGVASSPSLTAIDQIAACINSSADGCPMTFEAKARVPAARQWASTASLLPIGTYAGVLSIDRMFGADAGSHIDGAVLILTIGIQS